MTGKTLQPVRPRVKVLRHPDTSLRQLLGDSVKAAGLGDGAKPKDPSSACERDKSTIAKLPLDAATRMPGCFQGHIQAAAAVVAA